MADTKLQIILAAKDISGRAFNKVQGRINAITGAVFSLKGGLATLGVGYGFSQIATEVLDIASSFELMEVKLDALTQGRGRETLEAINEWALEMPVNTRKAVDTFAMMQAMGLDPTIEKMQTLVDVSSIFGEHTMPRVARALGQMQSLGRLSAEELNQLAEAGINARKILTAEFGMTVEELQKSGIEIEKIVDAIWRGLDAQYSGAAQAAQNSWQGLTLTFRSYMEEMARQVMDAGVFEALKDHLGEINELVGTWLERNKDLIRIKVPEYVERVEGGISKIWKIVSENKDILTYGLVGLALYGKAGAVIGAATGAEMRRIEAIARGLEMVEQGYLSISTFLESLHPRAEVTLEMLTKGAEDYGQSLPLEEMKHAVTLTEDLYERAKKLGTLEPLAMPEPSPEFAELFDISMAKEIADSADLLLDATQAQLGILNQLTVEGDEWIGDMELMIDEMYGQTDKTYDAMVDLTQNTAERMQATFSDFFFDAMEGELKSLEDYFDAFMASINRSIADLLSKQLVEGLFGAAAGGGGTGGGLFGGFWDWFTNLFSAKGHAFGPQGVIPMASGAVIDRPTFFPFARGIGLMGESGPEAIMPLMRTRTGELGVKAAGTSGQRIVNNFNISVQAPEGRLPRQSMSQLEYDLGRAVQRSMKRNR